MKKRITITGSIGSGKTTVGKILSKTTNYELISIGSIQRKLAEGKGLNILQLNKLAQDDKEIDKTIDKYIKGLSEKEQIIVDSRLAWFLIKDTLKVYLYVDTKEAAKRIYTEQRETEGKFKSMEEVENSIIERKNSETQRYTKLYGVDIHDNMNYDLIIDTSNKTPHEVAKIIKDYKEGYSLLIDTCNIRPTLRLRETNEKIVNDYVKKIRSGYEIEPLEVSKYNNKYYIIRGHHRLIAYFKLNIYSFKCKISNRIPDILENYELYDWEDLLEVEYL